MNADPLTLDGNPRVSVLMAVHNGERFLREAIDSVLAQTFSAFEFVIVEDGSTDGTRAILESYQDSRIRVVRNPANIGLTRSLNLGLAECRGELVARMDADDVSLPNRLQEEEGFLSMHSEVGVVGSQVTVIDEVGTVVASIPFPTGKHVLLCRLLLLNPLAHPTVMFRRELVLAVGGYDESLSYAQDYDMWQRIAGRAGIAVLPTPLLKYRRYGGQVTMNRFAEQERCMASIARRRLRDKWGVDITSETLFAMRQILAVYAPGTRPVTQQAIDTLVEIVRVFVDQARLNAAEAEGVRRDMGASLVRFGDSCASDLAECAMQRGIELINDPLYEYLLTQRTKLSASLSRAEAQACEIQHDLEAIRGSRAWRLVTRWHALRAAMRRFRKHARPEGGVASSPTAVVHGRKILFISHTATPSGAPALLLHFLQWLKGRGGIDFEIVLKADGSWQSMFAELAPVMIWNGSKEQREHLAQSGFGLIYSNTMTNGRLLDELAFLGLPVVTHAHELDFWMRNLTDRRDIDGVLAQTSEYVAVSAAVKRALVEKWGVLPERVRIVNGFVPVPDPGHTDVRRAIRQELGISKNAFVVVASGGSTWWKGADLFPRLADVVLRSDPVADVHFVWIGGDRDGIEYGMLRHDVDALGLTGRVHFLGWRPNPLDFYRAADVFTLLSRADSFPLVMLEAASVDTPVLCFAGSGGAPEFVGEDCGFVVPYLDVDAMAAHIVDLRRSPDLRRRLGFAAAEKVRALCNVRVVAPQILEIIQATLDSESGRTPAAQRKSVGIGQ